MGETTDRVQPSKPNTAAAEALGRLQDASIPKLGEVFVAYGDPPQIPKPAVPSAAGSERADLHKDAKGKVDTVGHKKFNSTMNFGRDTQGNLNEVKTVDSAADGSPKPARVYVKEGDSWFYKSPDGQKMPMQGELRVNDDTGLFTQVLRGDIDGAGSNEETTRTLDAEGTDAINRMDRSKSIFKHDAKGNASEWIEKDSAGVEKSFLPDAKVAGLWKSADGEERYNPKVEDHGNVVYQKKEDLGKDITRVITSSGDHLINGGNGVKYDFNYRGDVTSIQFPSPRLFEGHIVKRIDIGYRDANSCKDPIANQGQIIDSLRLYNAQNQPFMTLSRIKGKEDKPTLARNEWAAFDGWGRQLGYRGQDGKFLPSRYMGDFAIKNGLISTTEPLPADKAQLEKYMTANPKTKEAVEAFNKSNPGKPATKVICTYENSATTSKTNTPNGEEYSVKALAGDPHDLDYPVPGEASYMVPGVSPLSSRLEDAPLVRPPAPKAASVPVSVPRSRPAKQPDAGTVRIG